jgi:glyoxylase-like metal-dependent hydrolase (beta-lactamase superfamily II)
MSYTLGLHEVAAGTHAYLQPDGGWGWSNAGLVVGDSESLLVDTLFDLKITQRMLDAMAGVTHGAGINTVVNTHANGDHCYGNQLLKGSEIIASAATAHEMSEVPPAMLAALNKAPGEVGDLFRHFFGEFEFDGIEPVLPTQTFTGRHSFEVGGRTIDLVEVGPAHTQGDTLVFVPDAKTVYTGDILFIGGTPVVWVGPLDNWIAACDLICSSDVDHIVPGHGPLTDKAGVTAIRDYLVYVQGEAAERFNGGMDAWDAARDIALNGFEKWGEFGRLAVNVDTVYRTMDPTHKSPDVVEQFRRMFALEQQGH